ncbi:Fc.00g056330.m01.CDS01 [Cosmosporella sp. VM-42]
MEATDLYGICIGGFIAFLIVFSFCRSLARSAYRGSRVFFLRHVYYSHLPRWVCGNLGISRYSGSIIGLFLIANVCFIGIGVSDNSDFTRRLGRAALINLIPLYGGGRISSIVNLLSLRPESYLLAHKCIGVVFIVEVSLHSLLSWTHSEVDLTQGPAVAGLIAACSVGAIALTSIPILWRWMYECVSFSHMVLAITGIASLWFHLKTSKALQTPNLYLSLATLTFILVKIVRFFKVVYTNVSTKKVTTASIQRIGRGVEVQVSMPRPFSHHAGQFVFLSIPRLAALQSHPFQVAWDHLDEKGNHVIVLIIEPRHGFTGKLLLANPDRDYMALIEGPYGSPVGLDQYGTVLLFATGIGIVGQLPYMKEQLNLYREWRTKTRRYALFWEMNDEEYRYWVREWMNELLSWDLNYDIQLFIRGHYIAKNAVEGATSKQGKDHFRITLNYTSMQPDTLINSEMQKRKGRMLVSMCANPSTTRTITEFVHPMLGQDIDLVELDFRPWSRS